MNFLNKIFDFIFPEFCKLCQRPLRDSENLICNNCFSKLPFLKLYCQKCGTPLPDHLKDFLSYKEINYCSYCQTQKFYFDKTFSAFYYKKPVSDWIISLKFGKEFNLGYRLGKLLKSVFIDKIPEVDLVIPVPLSSERLKVRGFNQSFLIAWGFLGKRPSQEFLKRIKCTKPQTELSQKERWKNVKNVFEANPKVKNKTILLIDDVMTTGATLNEASKALKKAGAKEIYVLTIAKNTLN